MLMFYTRSPLMLIFLAVPLPSRLVELPRLLPDRPTHAMRPRPERQGSARRLRVESKPLPRAILLAGDRFGCNGKTSFRRVRG